MNLSAPNHSLQRGLTLIEIMLAMVLGLFLLAGLLSLFIGNKQAYRAQEASSRLQENARFALDLLNREARKAGYQAAFTTTAGAFPAAATGSVERNQCVNNGAFTIGIGRSLTAPPSHTTVRTGHVHGGSAD